MSSEALAKEGRPMHYVYLLESVSALGQRYIGVTYLISSDGLGVSVCFQ
jgi:hypothetical protein